MTSMLNYPNPKDSLGKGMPCPKDSFGAVWTLWNKQLMLSAIIVFAGVFVLSSCGGDDDKPKPKPVTVTSLSVTEGPAGTTVTVNGTNFDAVVAKNKVFFGKKEAKVTGGTTTTLTTKVPVGAATGFVYVQVGTGAKIKGPNFTVKQNQLTIDLKGVNNDAEEARVAYKTTVAGFMDLASSDLELGDIDGDYGYQFLGTRFMNIAIPKGSVIEKAYIQFSADDYGNSPLVMKIWGEKEDTGEFTKTLKNISSRMKTTAAVSWEVPEWTQAEVTSTDKTKFRGPKQATADLKAIVQEIIDGANWNSGGNMTFIFDIESDVNTDAFKAGIRGREVETWSNDANTAGTTTNLSEAAASLIIEFR